MKKNIRTCKIDKSYNHKVPHNSEMTENMISNKYLIFNKYIFNKKEMTMVNNLHIKKSVFKFFLFLMYEYVDIFTTAERLITTQHENQ